MLKSARFLVVLGMLLTTAGFAQELYHGAVPVPDQSAGERAAALPDALIQVLQKQSGRRELAPHPALDEALGNPENLLLAFHYREVERARPDGGTDQQLRLVASFLPEAVDRLVRELGLPRWRLQRRPVVIWPVLDDGGGRTLMPLEYQYVYDTAEDVAALRGLPVAWPDLSEELLAGVDLQLLWGGYIEQLMPEGSDVGGVAVVAARREGPEWNLRWSYADRSTSSSWRTRDGELTFAVVEGIHHLTDVVAAAHSVSPAGLGSWHVEVDVAGMRSGADYARCLSYLEGLSVVDRVQVTSARPGSARFVLQLNARPEDLERSIGMDRVLEKGTGEREYRVVH